ncbi:MAG: VCBS repeat-containing protein, partial [Ekhidna sp.]|nr:VCBS repeat-containing protein [Ekhidna sp.]
MLCLTCGTASAQFTFTEKESTPFPRVERSSIAFADVNKDGHPDVLITGNTGSERIAKLYLNDGSGGFTEKMETPFAGVNNNDHDDRSI